MASTFDVLCLLSQAASQETAPAGREVSFGGQAFQTAVVASGLCVLAVWVIRRLAYRKKLLLALSPNRPNSLGLLHVVGLLLLMFAMEGVMHAACMTLFGRPEPDSLAGQKALVLGAMLARLPVLAAVLLVAHYAFRFGLANGLGLSMRHWFYDSARGLLAVLAVYPVCTLLMFISQQIFPETLHRTHFILAFLVTPDLSAGWKILAISMAVLLAPVLEELLFRGILQSALRQHLGRPWLAIALVSALFSLTHVDFQTLQGLPDVLPLFTLALVLGYNYERCGRLWPAILTHLLFNAINIAVFLWP